jgi:NADH-quinone oxidoreductase subunit J
MQALFFYLFGVVATICALATVTRRDAVTSAFWLIACFLNVAALFAMLSAHFMAVLQVLIYAGAIMVFFLFVTMFLGEPEKLPARRGRLVPLVGSLTVLGLAFVLSRLLEGESARAFPPAMEGYGSIAAVSQRLLVDYIFLFEVTGLLLLVAVIGAVYIARRPRAVATPGQGGGHA